MSAEVAAATAPVVEPVAATEPVAAVEAPATTAVEAPAAEETKAEEPVAPAAADATVKPTEEKVSKDEVKITAEPISEGTLSFKGPGLLKNFIFREKHFWFGDEPLTHETLSAYLKNEKDKAVAHHNVAHATETGKGLLFFSKRHEDKAAPEGIINLGNALKVTREAGDNFSFKVNDKTYQFHAPSTAEVDRWVVSVETAVKDAIANKEVVVNGEKYKLTKEKLAKPAAAAGVGAAAGAAVGAASKDKVHDGTSADSTTATAAATEEKKEEKPRSDSKGRSASRKRQSIFGTLLGKKDDKAVDQANEKEAAKEEKAEEKAEEAAKPEETAAEPVSDKAIEAAPIDVVAPAEPVAAATGVEEPKVEEPAAAAAAVEEPKAEEVKAEEPAAAATAPKSKRASVFGFFSSKKSGDVPIAKEAAKEESAPAVPAKDTPVADAAPQLDPVDTTTASEAAPIVDAPVPTEAAAVPAVGTEEPHTSPLLAVEATPEAKAANKQKEGGDLFSFMKKKRAEHEGKVEDKSEGAAAAEKTEGTSVSPTEKRRSSFFNTLGGKKERAASPEGEKKGLGGLFRKASKSQKSPTGPVTDSSVPPAIPATEETAVADAPAVEAPAVEEAAKVEEPIAASTDAAPAIEAVNKEIPAVADAPVVTDAATEATPAPVTTAA